MRTFAPITYVPASGSSRPEIVRKSVVLPQPFGPSRQTRSFFWISTSTFLNSGLPAKPLPRPFVSSTSLPDDSTARKRNLSSGGSGSGLTSSALRRSICFCFEAIVT